jgi:hypothetical protein
MASSAYSKSTNSMSQSFIHPALSAVPLSLLDSSKLVGKSLLRASASSFLGSPNTHEQILTLVFVLTIKLDLFRHGGLAARSSFNNMVGLTLPCAAASNPLSLEYEFANFVSLRLFFGSNILPSQDSSTLRAAYVAHSVGTSNQLPRYWLVSKDVWKVRQSIFLACGRDGHGRAFRGRD